MSKEGVIETERHSNNERKGNKRDKKYLAARRIF